MNDVYLYLLSYQSLKTMSGKNSAATAATAVSNARFGPNKPHTNASMLDADRSGRTLRDQKNHDRKNSGTKHKTEASVKESTPTKHKSVTNVGGKNGKCTGGVVEDYDDTAYDAVEDYDDTTCDAIVCYGDTTCDAMQHSIPLLTELTGDIWPSIKGTQEVCVVLPQWPSAQHKSLAPYA